jgi:hypothetical protein
MFQGNNQALFGSAPQAAASSGWVDLTVVCCGAVVSAAVQR